MDNFRSICFIYNKEDSFDLCYLKEFFKWLGFTYIEHMHGHKNIFIERPKDCAFDIIVNINSALTGDEISQIKNNLPARFYELIIPQNLDGAREQVILSDLLQKILCEEDRTSVSGLFNNLFNIYTESHLIDILYSYTLVLHQKMMTLFADMICDRLSNALAALENVILSWDKEDGLEYALYAKYVLQSLINEYLLVQKRMERYEIKEFLDAIDEVYKYDKGFYKVGYLKAQVAKQNCMHNAQTKHFFSTCIEQCPVNVCKSVFYYDLGKSYQMNKCTPNYVHAASEAYHHSYKHNPNYTKAIFKLAVEKKKAGEDGLARAYLQNIIDMWTESDDISIMPLHDVEYAYKTRILFSELVDQPFRVQWKQAADAFMDFIKADQKNIPNSSFIKRMYPNDIIEAICDAMYCRVNLLHEIKCFK